MTAGPPQPAGRPATRVAYPLAVFALIGILTACDAGGPSDDRATSSEARVTTSDGSAPPTEVPEAASAPLERPRAPETVEYLEGVEADVHLPAGEGAGVVVLVPGGSWETADRQGLTPLAEELASRGILVVNATYRARVDGGGYPSMVEDVVCAARFARARAAQAGVESEPVVVVGHSAGAHLAVMAALMADALHPACPEPPSPIDAMVGLAGPYDVSLVPRIADNLFGFPPEEDPELWAQGNPFTYVASRPDVPALLLHGDADDTVDVSFTEEFAEALRTGGHDVDVLIVPGANHASIYGAEAGADPIADWVQSLD